MCIGFNGIVAIVGFCGIAGNWVISTWVYMGVGSMMGALLCKVVGEWICVRLGGATNNLLGPRLDRWMGIEESWNQTKGLYLQNQIRWLYL
jgi:hypothetical protein